MIYVFLKFIFIAAQIKYVLLKISSLSFLNNIELSNSEVGLGFKNWIVSLTLTSLLFTMFGTLNILLLWLLIYAFVSLFGLNNIRSTKRFSFAPQKEL